MRTQSLRLRVAIAVGAAIALATVLLGVAVIALEGRVGSRRLLVEVVDRRGRIVARSASLGGEVLGTPAEIANVIRSGRARYSNARLGGESLRVYGAPLAALGSSPAAGGAVLV